MICDDCTMAQTLATGVVVGVSVIAIESAHANCTRSGCACGCGWSKGLACPDCRAYNTKRGKDGRCRDKKSCAATLAAFYGQKRAIREANVASGVSRPTRNARGPRRACECGCGNTTGGGRFRPGHNMRSKTPTG